MNCTGICCRLAVVVPGVGWSCPEHGESSNRDAVSDERCKTCDRPRHSNHQVFGDMCKSPADCEANRVGWRARALNAEASITEWLMSKEAEYDRLRAFVETGINAEEVHRAMQHAPLDRELYAMARAAIGSFREQAKRVLRGESET